LNKLQAPTELHVLKITQTKGKDYAVILQSSALNITQTKKRSSKLGVFSYCAIYS
jgi:hypothetical protein